MAVKVKTEREKQAEAQIALIARLFERNGVVVRRENLSRGQAYRVKSGQCLVDGDKFVFVDKRLPQEQQIAVLIDYLVDFGFDLNEEEEHGLSSQTRALLRSRSSKAA